MAALIAAPQVAAEGLGPASQDVGDGTAMRGWHRRAMDRQIAVREPATGDALAIAREAAEKSGLDMNILDAAILGDVKHKETAPETAAIENADRGHAAGRRAMICQRTPPEMQSTFQTISALLVLAALFGFVNGRLLKLPRSIGILVLSLAFSVCVIGIDGAVPSLQIKTFASEHVEAAALPRALFDGALAFLMFAAALEVSFSDLWSRKGTIAVLATVGVAMTALLMGLGMWQVFEMLGLSVPVVWCLVLGAAVAPTDPVAVMGALRRIGLPTDLQGMIVGESLFNDGVGIVLFSVLVAAATRSESHASWIAVAVDFVREAFGGGALGLVTGYVAYAAMRQIDEYNVELMISIALVTATYSLAQALQMSGPIAVVAAGLVIGTRAKQHAMSEHTRQHLDTVWSVFDEILNALLCLMIGLEILVVDFSASGSVVAAAAIAAILSLVVRFVSVSSLAFLLYGPRARMRAVTVLTWAGLRGGISIALVLSMPDTAYRQSLLVACYGIVLFTMLVQGLTLERVAGRLFPGTAGKRSASHDDPRTD